MQYFLALSQQQTIVFNFLFVILVIAQGLPIIVVGAFTLIKFKQSKLLNLEIALTKYYRFTLLILFSSLFLNYLLLSYSSFVLLVLALILLIVIRFLKFKYKLDFFKNTIQDVLFLIIGIIFLIKLFRPSFAYISTGSIQNLVLQIILGMVAILILFVPPKGINKNKNCDLKNNYLQLLIVPLLLIGMVIHIALSVYQSVNNAVEFNTIFSSENLSIIIYFTFVLLGFIFTFGIFIRYYEIKIKYLKIELNNK